MIQKKRGKTVHIPGLTDLPPLPRDVPSLMEDFRHYYTYNLGRDKFCRSVHYHYKALALAVRDRLMEDWKNTRYAYLDADCKRGYYLSLEFLMGRALGNAMLNLGVTDTAAKALMDLGIAMEDLAEAEVDAGLGNGGLGRLAACFLDSCATLQLPVMGYGIRYEYGMFRQRIVNGHQVEEPDHWLRNGNPWEIERQEYTQRVCYGGRTERYGTGDGGFRVRWVDTHDVLAIPYDTPVPGYSNGTVNTLRLWKSVATDAFNLVEFNAGSYTESVAAKNEAENITMVLYPNDASESGKALRLRQQYFLASASLQDVIERWVVISKGDFSGFAEKNCFQLNDTHPSCAVPELMRLLMDEQGMGWDEAWGITTRTMAYTNHTLLPEALEKWPLSLFAQLLPRLLEIILEINARFLAEVASRWPGDHERLRRMSLIEEGPVPQVRMAYLAIVGSFSVNGVAALHSQLLAQGLFRDFHELWPHKFNNKTNGVTPRRWLAWCNPGLSRLITETIGDGWVSDLSRIGKIAAFADDPGFREKWREVKRANKERLAAMVLDKCCVAFDPEALFDVQVKRIHEYKRQLLNILHVIHLYDRIKRGDTEGWTNRCVLIGGKAAPGYFMAKLIIKLTSNVAQVVNADPQVGDRLKVAFLPNYRVTAMEVVCPGTDLSEQISTAGKEASGTGNMKFMMNGALTIGTLDGANIEIREEVGDANFFMFGLTAEEVEAARRGYDPGAIIEADADLGRVMNLLAFGHFNLFEPGIFDPIIGAITSPHDPWMVAADFRSYVNAQQRVAAAYRDREQWARMSIINSASSGKFSTDRTIREYNDGIWGLQPVPVLAAR
ncbi:glycogen/starch/alpha-glucan phosphorylase [Geobacter metallireducens RCH3]|uniref:Alpha-1,4 glucan phosphorylase n=1 Tax=Geobacter metallireducens (strain ATCC 53774 / DSM 7210 / GS-15) TaxID=269799 RepID=Q39RY9_GEOMG|nr:glycogen/starch/alpha-glucan phosphorylase [Geobacter metallireducens]ABB32985.1 glucan phosphorylase [Geobacter metallireducens GS-15]EHP88881.1 glycogen/starch/alpha-glucan phosphorylase [Geobacter metallireducens RCH3]